jgi:ribosomal protein S27AE
MTEPVRIPLPEGTAITARLQGVVDEMGWLVLADGCRIPPEHYAIWAGCPSAVVTVLVPGELCARCGVALAWHSQREVAALCVSIDYPKPLALLFAEEAERDG